MRFDILTLFPGMFDSYFSESILKRAQTSGHMKIAVRNIRDFATDKHKTTDDIPYGGGAGMVMKVEPIWRCLQHLMNDEKEDSLKVKTRIILFSAKGKRFTQRDAERLTRYNRIVLICGRYEGVDERVAEHIADEEFSIGEYVLTGGEIPAMAVVDSVARLLPGVLGNEESLKEESFTKYSKVQMPNAEDEELNGREKEMIEENFLEYPHYTRPEEFNGWRVPEVLLSGNHKEIKEWREGKQTRKG